MVSRTSGEQTTTIGGVDLRYRELWNDGSRNHVDSTCCMGRCTMLIELPLASAGIGQWQSALKIPCDHDGGDMFLE